MMFRKILCLVCTLILAVPLVSCQPESDEWVDPDFDLPSGAGPLPAYDTSRFVQTFADNFDGAELDTSIWSYQTGGHGWGNGESQYYTAGDNVTVQNGYLYIEARRENRGNNIYTSSRIRTAGGFAQTYGRFEARIKLPMEQGLWPAFWMMPEQGVYGGWPYSGEIDIMEARGRQIWSTSSAIHYQDSLTNAHKFQTKAQYFDSKVTDIGQFHLYAVEWEPGAFRFFVDDRMFLEITDWTAHNLAFPSPFDRDFHLILNLAVGGHFDGYILPREEMLPARMIVDYVRAFSFV